VGSGTEIGSSGGVATVLEEHEGGTQCRSQFFLLSNFSVHLSAIHTAHCNIWLVILASWLQYKISI
jgi:hypothetical protein